MIVTRRLLLAGLSGAAANAAIGPALANVTQSPRPRLRPPPPLPPDLGSVTLGRIAEAGLSGDVACVLADANTGAIRFAYQQDLALPPASTAKAITAAYGFDLLGIGHRFETQVIGTAPVRDGVLQGDLILAGGGAPGLATGDLAELCATLKAAGLRAVTGRFEVWGGALPRVEEIDPGQPDHLGYNPSVSGLNLNYNRVHFEWRRAGADYSVSMDARGGGYTPQVTHSRMQVAGRSAPLFALSMDADTGRESWSVARSGLGGGGTRWLPVRNSALYAGDVFRTLARAQGIALPVAQERSAPPQGLVLASLYGPPLSEVAAGMLKYSTNLTAEAIGMSATKALLGRAPGTLAASGAAMSGWASGPQALGMTESRFVDHSGLGDTSRVTARDMAAALARLGPDGALRRAMKDIPLKREDGTRAPLQLFAKTGTLNFVSALCGHIRPEGGPPLVFAILTADLARRAAIPPGGEENPPGTRTWTRRSRAMQFDLVQLWARYA
ncbi:D-alanyl-D-alanine carboxypeptidase/D-alanyl-D-alanine-endopeptidase [Meridianimarinicoccus roseus]|uniref:D-alanyl-D-alanine carboxypeptidase/D-alanyl-D-alanine-endopeptidase n=1 Tax=Meridianimarinicoccus roseus TaxID=2072018 RepID=A0A2V2LD31_9RHOB|nr:D-alanyl-D-alanine carboxypeptidase/D-alanyl-D-alanine-endopeptidase [Meridianimarinicoccus roseus]PWR03285.1 D-alanyl-D-alanine carboxypeptidase/D-alanyl-D-alanine-endopeptidase [Meridianimarinicoccus roseus]